MAVSLVIGGRRGVGLVVSEYLRSRGEVVYTVGRSNIDSDYHICCDITTECSPISESVETISSIIFAHRYRGTDWDMEFKTTVKGIKNVIEAVRHQLKPMSSVVILGSNAKDFVVREQSLQYHASRSCLEGLMQYYAVNLGRVGVRFNCILPSTMIKPENEDFFNSEVKTKEMIGAITPLGRMGCAKDIAYLVGFLCSDEASFITGNSIYVDGGLSLVGQESLARDCLGKQR